MTMALPADRAVAADAAEPEVSALRASIPSAPVLSLWVDHRRRHLHWDFDNGPLNMVLPLVVKPEEINDLDELFELVIAGLRRTAQAIETRRAETPSGSVHESAITK